MSRRLVLFDIDGTLLIAGGIGRRAFSNAFLELFSVQEAYGDTRAHGKTDPLLIDEIATRTLRRSLTEEEYGLLKSGYIRHFGAEIEGCTTLRVLPGVPEALSVLSQIPGTVMGVETGNFRETAQLKLQHPGIGHYFATGGFGCDAPCRNEIVRVAIERAATHAGITSSERFAEVVVIGDSLRDVEAAHANGAKSVLVLTGGIDPETARRSGADFVLEDLREIEPIRSLVAG